MNSLDIQNTKIELIQWLASLDNLSIINKLVDLRKQESQDWWESISEDEKQSIDKAITDADLGKLYPHSNARKLYEKWL